MARPDQVAIFCSYSHKDEDLRAELFQHLELLKQSGIIRAWYDGEITAGQTWHEKIEQALRSADIVLLLVSIHLLTSEFIRQYELPIALERYKAGEALIIPVLLRPVTWSLSGLEAFQALPDGMKPVVFWRPRDKAYVAILEGLIASIMAWRKHQPPSDAVPAHAPVTRNRVLDVGLPHNVPVGLTTVLAVMVRRPESRGLAGLLDLEERYGVKPEEVESSGAFPVDFPRDSTDPLEFGVRVESADFDCSTTSKALYVPPDRDSDVCVFLLTARRAGSLVVNVELTYKGKRVAGCLLRANGVADSVFAPAVQASVALTFEGGRPEAPAVAAGAIPAPPAPPPALPERQGDPAMESEPAIVWQEADTACHLPSPRDLPPAPLERPKRRNVARVIAAGTLLFAVGASLLTLRNYYRQPPVAETVRPDCFLSGAILSCTAGQNGVARVLIQQNGRTIVQQTLQLQARGPAQIDLRRLIPRPRAGEYGITVEVAGQPVFSRTAPLPE